jgi:hypothetical protein
MHRGFFPYVSDLMPLRRGRAGAPPDRLADAEEFARRLGVERATRRCLLYFVLPAWIGAALLDWQRHRQTKIKETAGTHESLIHALMMAERGRPVLMGLFLEINALVLAVMVATFLVHEATAFWDVAYTNAKVKPAWSGAWPMEVPRWLWFRRTAAARSRPPSSTSTASWRCSRSWSPPCCSACTGTRRVR